MHMRQSSNTGDRLPEYIAFDRNGPPAYPSDDLRGSPARPKKAHTHLPHDETRAGASSPSYADDYAYTHNGSSSDMEANMAAASTDHLAARIEDRENDVTNAPRRPHPTVLDVFAILCLLCAVIFWPMNIFLKTTDELCSGMTSKVIFCGGPALAILALWIAMLQEQGCWAISREGRTAEQFRRMTIARLMAMLLFIPSSVVLLLLAISRFCGDRCET